MKKNLFYFILAILPFMTLTFASCSNDNLPKVKISINVADNTPVIDGTICVIQDDSIHVKNLTVTNLEEGKNAMLNQVVYYLDGYRYTPTVAQNTSFYIPTAKASAGNHEIEVSCQVLAEGKSVAYALCKFPVLVIPVIEDFPTNGDKSSTIEFVTDLQNSEK